MISIILRVDRRNTISKPRDAAFSAYYGGMPAVIDTDGEVDIATGNDVVAIGVFYNDHDKETATTAAYIWSGITPSAVHEACVLEFPCSVTMVANADGNAPFEAEAWNEADRVYIHTTGKWTRTNPSATITAADNSWGDVIESVSVSGVVTELTAQLKRRG